MPGVQSLLATRTARSAPASSTSNQLHVPAALGGYILLHPHNRVRAIVLRGIMTEIPAWVAIGVWFLFQLISGLGMLGGGTQVGGVAYAAHIGGFVAGLALVKLFDIGRGAERQRA